MRTEDIVVEGASEWKRAMGWGKQWTSEAGLERLEACLEDLTSCDLPQLLHGHPCAPKPVVNGEGCPLSACSPSFNWRLKCAPSPLLWLQRFEPVISEG